MGGMITSGTVTSTGTAAPTTTTTADGSEVSIAESLLLKRDYLQFSRQSNNTAEKRLKVGFKTDYNVMSGQINRPHPIGMDGEDLVCVQYYDDPCVLSISSDGEYQYKEQLPATYQNPTAANTGIGYAYGGCLDRENNRLSIASWARHIVRQYDLDGNLMFTIGVPSSYGNVDDGKLRYPSTTFYTPEGELAVVSYHGKGAGCTSWGHITCYDATTGEFIATRSGSFGARGTQPETGGTYLPNDAAVAGDKLYVSVYGRSKVAVLDMSTTDADGYWPVIKTLYLPSTALFGSNNSSTCANWGICTITGGLIAVYSLRNNEIYGINPDSGETEWTIDLKKEGYQGDCRRILEIEPGFIVMGSWGSSLLQVVPVPGALTEQYEVPSIPDGWEVYNSSDRFDTSTGILTLDCLDAVAPDHITLAIREI